MLPLLTVTWKRCVWPLGERNISAHDQRYVRHLRRKYSSKRLGSSAWIASQLASKRSAHASIVGARAGALAWRCVAPSPASPVGLPRVPERPAKDAPEAAEGTTGFQPVLGPEVGRLVRLPFPPRRLPSAHVAPHPHHAHPVEPR